MAQEVDLTYRTVWAYQHAAVQRFYRALTLALLIHILAAIMWLHQAQTEAAHVPDWINIKLVAAIDSPARMTSPGPPPVTEIKPLAPDTSTRQSVIPSKTARPLQQASVAQDAIHTAHPAELLDNPRPLYPRSARQRGMQGVVLVRVMIDARGRATHTEVVSSSGFTTLDRAAVQSIAGWHFRPARRGDEPVESSLEIPVRFILQDAE